MKGVLFHHDNAPAHTPAIAMAAINDCGFELIQHFPYSHDLAPSDLHLFAKLKKKKKPFLIPIFSQMMIHTCSGGLSGQSRK